MCTLVSWIAQTVMNCVRYTVTVAEKGAWNTEISDMAYGSNLRVLVLLKTYMYLQLVGFAILYISV